MTTVAMATPHQEQPHHERLQVTTTSEETSVFHQVNSWPSDNHDCEENENTFYRTPKRNKRKNFKPRCAPNTIVCSDEDRKGSGSPLVDHIPETSCSPDNLDESEIENGSKDPSKFLKIGVKHFSLLKGPGVVDLSRRFSTDSNENIDDTTKQFSSRFDLTEDTQKRFDSRFQQSYIQSLHSNSNDVQNDDHQSRSQPQNFVKSYCPKNPFAISQLIKTNSPPRRRSSDDCFSDPESKIVNQDINANERSSIVRSAEGMDVGKRPDTECNNGENLGGNNMLTDFAVNTMKELLGIYGLSTNEVHDAISGHMRTLEALQGKQFHQVPLSLKRRMSPTIDGPADRRMRRSSSGTTEDEGSANITPPKTPDGDEIGEIQRQRALQQYLSQQSFGRLFGHGGSVFNSGERNADDGDDNSIGSTDGEQTLDLSVSKDADAQDLSTTSSAGNSVTDFEQNPGLTLRRNLEDFANLHAQGYFQKSGSLIIDTDDSQSSDTRKLHQAGLLSALGHLDPARKIGSQSGVDYSRYVKRYSSSLECGSSYCKDLGYREHFHCMDCTARVFCKKEEMIRHFKWHKKRDESLAHGFMRYSPLDDCSERYQDCPHNRSQTHYHCIQDGCDKVYISTSDVQMHANYHRKDSAILQEGFQRFRATETCSASHCAFQGQRTTHFHCRRTGCTYTFKNKADMEKHKTYHIKDEQLARDGFKKYMKSEPCPYRECRFSRACNHIHCTRPRCNYVLHSSSQLFSHKRKHERKDQEMGFGLQTSVLQNAILQQQGNLSDVSISLKAASSSPTGSFNADLEDNSMNGMPQSMTSFSQVVHGGVIMPGTPDHDGLMQQTNLSQLVLDEVCRKYVETFEGARESDDKCRRCSAFNKHYHCLAEGCDMAHSCHNTMLKHALDHEHQAQVTEAFFSTHGSNNPCNNSGCHQIRDVTHYHCTWENCSTVILPSEENPFKRLEHHRQHTMLGPMSPTLPLLPQNLASQLHPNMAAQLSQNIQSLPPNLAHLAQMAPNLAQMGPNMAQMGQNMAQMAPNLAQMAHMTPNLAAQMGVAQSPISNMGPVNSLDEMFSRKRGRPPKNRVVEVWTDNVTPQAIFTSFKLPKSSQPPVPSVSTTEEFSRIKFQNFEVYTSPEACSNTHPGCSLKMSKLHLHCALCNFSGETHTCLETHCRENHSISQLLQGFEFYTSCEQCNGKMCFKNQLRSHFHCVQSNTCSAILTQYSALATHKHGRGTPVKLGGDLELSVEGRYPDEAKDYSVKREPVDGVENLKIGTGLENMFPANFSMKSEDLEANSAVSVVKATGTFYPSSHLRSNALSQSPPARHPDTSPNKSGQSQERNTFTPTIPPSCQDASCQLNKKAGFLNLHYHCPHCSQAYVDLKLLYGHMVKKHSSAMDSNTLGLVATKETLEREYPEISILPSTASASASNASSMSPTIRPQNSNDQVQAVHSLLLQQYLNASSIQQQAAKKSGLSLQEQLKYQQQYNASMGGNLGPHSLAGANMGPHSLAGGNLGALQGLNPAQLAQMAFLSQGGSPFPLYPSMLYPPELLLEQTLLAAGSPGLGQTNIEKEAEMMVKKSHSRSGPHMRVMKDEPIPEGYLRFRFNEDCAYQHCGYREHQTHFHCTRKDCGYSFCDKTRFVQHTARHERLDTLMGGDFQQYRANVYCNRPDCAHASNFGSGQNKASHFHCLKCDFVCTDTNKVVAHRRQHQKMDSIQAAGFDKFPPSKGCGYEPQCIHSRKQTHYHCLQCGFAVLGLSQMTSHKYRHQETNQGAGSSNH